MENSGYITASRLLCSYINCQLLIDVIILYLYYETLVNAVASHMCDRLLYSPARFHHVKSARSRGTFLYVGRSV